MAVKISWTSWASPMTSIVEIYEEMKYPFKKTSRINFFFICDDILPPPGGLL
jgi:hypothetical protein